MARKLARRESETVVEVGPAAHGHGPPPLNEGETLIGIFEPLEGATVQLPTIGMHAIFEAASRDGLKVLSENGEAVQMGDGWHFIQDVHVVRHASGKEVGRSRVMIYSDDYGPKHPWVTWADLPLRALGTIADSVQRSKMLAAPHARSRNAKRPRWAGAHSFDRVYERASFIDRWLGENMRNLTPPPRALMNDTAMHGLDHAHVVRVDPEQVEVLPEWESMENMCDYARDLMLPFETIYLDFEGPGGVAPHIRVSDQEIALHGCLVWTFPGEEDTPLFCMPFGWQIVGDEIWPNLDEIGDITPYDQSGIVILNQHLGLGDEGEVQIDSGAQSARAVAFSIDTLTPEEDDSGPLTGHVQIPISAQRAYERGLGVVECRGWAIQTLALAAKSLAALSILEAEEVEIVPAPLHRRDIKRAEKRGWKISDIVRVRPPKRYEQRSTPSGEEARYSHRFWVRATVAHFPIGTMVADARPDLVKPCPRCGFCRRVKRSAHIKGPPDKPLVLKSLVVNKRDRVTT